MGSRVMVAALAALAALAVMAGGLAPRPAAAGSGDFVGGVITGVIGSAIVGNVQKNRARQSAAPTRRSYYNATVRDTQVALNYFGFPAGPADGVRGAKTRRAASLYQGYMGYPVTGRLTEAERAFLYASHQRALAEEPRTSRLVASLADGRKGLLKRYQGQPAGGSFAGLPPSVSEAVHEIAANAEPSADQLVQTAGFVQMADLNQDGRNDYILDTSVTGSGFWCQQGRCAVRVFASTPQGYVRNDFLVNEARPASFTCQAGSCALAVMPEPAPAPAPAPAPDAPKMASAPTGGGELPNLLGGGAGEQTLAAHCDAVAAGTSSGSAGRVIDQQFCFARAVAISDGDGMAKRVQRFSYDQIAAQCRALSGAMEAHVARLGDAGPEDVLGGVRDLVAGSGTPPAQLAGTARICLGIGYAEDDSEMALASALLAVATGAPAYGELLGHHLTKGFGVIPRRDLARAWYRNSFEAIEAGAERVFAPDQPGRIALIRAAALGEGDAEAGGALPVFSVAQ